MKDLSRWRRRAERPLVLGHRGARHAAPENTMAAFELALEEGADGVELDVRLDGDDEVVVIHDTTLERVTGGRDARRVESLRRAHFERIDLGGGETVPRLTTVLDWARARRTRVNVELKRDVRRPALLVRRVAALVAGVPHAPRHVLLSSFHPGFVLALARLLPEVPVAWLVHEKQRFLGAAPGFRALGAVAVHPGRFLCSPARVRAWRSAGALINVWTVNDAIEARDLAELGVDGIISDEPGEILAGLAG